MCKRIVHIVECDLSLDRAEPEQVVALYYPEQRTYQAMLFHAEQPVVSPMVETLDLALLYLDGYQD